MVSAQHPEAAMRALPILLLVLPLSAFGQGAIPQPMIPQTVVPGASAPAPQGYGYGATIVAPTQAGGGVILTPGYAPAYVVPPAIGERPRSLRQDMGRRLSCRDRAAEPRSSRRTRAPR
jgi:hypothetical protein